MKLNIQILATRYLEKKAFCFIEIIKNNVKTNKDGKKVEIISNLEKKTKKRRYITKKRTHRFYYLQTLFCLLVRLHLHFLYLYLCLTCQFFYLYLLCKCLYLSYLLCWFYLFCLCQSLSFLLFYLYLLYLCLGLDCLSHFFKWFFY